MARKIKSILPVDICNLIQQIGKIADEEEIRVYLVGGIVRDLILGRPNVDLDLVVEENGLFFASLLAEVLNSRVFYHENFATASIQLSNGIKIDIATARREYYEFPGALPTVKKGSLKQDLYRRDFTINAMAISLNQENWGQLIDYFNGLTDLEHRSIRVLHELSFVDDPTRLFRCIRFEKRYNFTIEGKTLALAQEAVRQNLLAKVSYDRIRNEFLLILKETSIIPIIKRLKQLGIWERIFPELELSQDVIRFLKEMAKSIGQIDQFVGKIDFHLVIFLILCHHANEQQVGTFCERFQWSKKYQYSLEKAVKEKNNILTTLTSADLTMSVLDKIFGELPAEIIIYFHIISERKSQKMIVKYLSLRNKWIPAVSGNDLKILGIKPGPIYKIILDRLREAKAEGEISSRDQEISFVKEFIERGD